MREAGCALSRDKPTDVVGREVVLRHLHLTSVSERTNPDAEQTHETSCSQASAGGGVRKDTGTPHTGSEGGFKSYVLCISVVDHADVTVNEIVYLASKFAGDAPDQYEVRL